MDTPQATQPASPTMTSAAPAHGKKKYFIYSLLGILLLILVAATAYGAITFLRSKVTGGIREPIFNNDTVTLPISIEDPEATSVAIVYKFNVKLRDVRKDGLKTQLLTNAKNPNPRFIISPENDTEIFFRSEDGDMTPAKIEDLKPGQNLEIFVAYGIQRKQWVVQRVFILETEKNSNDF
jgi:hypothetical protein